MIFFYKHSFLKYFCFILSSVCLFGFTLISCSGTPKKYNGLGLATDNAPLAENALCGTLKNGMRYYILENHRPRDGDGIALLTLAVNAGSGNEREKEKGYADFVKKVILKSTAKYKNANFEGFYLDSGLSSEIPAYAETSLEHTVFQFTVSTGTDENGIKTVPQAMLSMLNQLCSTGYFDSTVVNDVRSKTLEEIAESENAYKSVADRMRLQLIYKGCPLSEHVNILGTTQSIETIRPVDAERFYRNWYRPDNMALIFTGDFDAANLLDYLENNFNAPAGRKPFDRVVNELPVPQKNSTEIEIFKDKDIEDINGFLYYKLAPSTRVKSDIAEFRLSLIDSIILGTMTERFKNTFEDAPLKELQYYRELIGKSSGYFVIR
ncbi:MAG: insulinase family protein, partial [Spirochaetaceae bacterium]|nr:insulinase family protein [Spirochaetaceae bacterium]